MLRRVSFYEWIAIALLVLGGARWIASLEGRTLTTERDIATLRQEYREDVRFIREQLERLAAQERAR